MSSNKIMNTHRGEEKRKVNRETERNKPSFQKKSKALSSLYLRLRDSDIFRDSKRTLDGSTFKAVV